MNQQTGGFDCGSHVRNRRGVWTPLSVGAMVLGFVVFWPLGLAALAYNIWAQPGDFHRWLTRHFGPVFNESQGLNRDIGDTVQRFGNDMRALSDELREAWRRWQSRRG